VDLVGTSLNGHDMNLLSERDDQLYLVSANADGRERPGDVQVANVGGCGNVAVGAEVQNTALTNGDVATVRART